MKKIIFSKPTFLKAILFSISLFLFLIVLAFVGESVYAVSFERKALSDLSRGLVSEQQILVSQGDTFAANADLQKAVRSNDSYETLSVLNLLNTGKTTWVAVANPQGVIFSRTKTSFGRGDNAYVISPLGRALVQKGQPVFSIERSSVDPSQLIMSYLRNIYDRSTTLGGLFTTLLLNDSYASYFTHTYLPPGVQTVFYSRDYGLYGDSVTDPAVRKIITDYFYPNSAWIAQGKTNTTIRFPNGKYYRVINHVFSGIEHSPGGVILLVPIYGFWVIIRVAITCLVLVFCLFLLFLHRSKQKKLLMQYEHTPLVLTFIIVTIVIFSIDFLFIPAAEYVYPNDHVLYNSVLQFSPSVKVFDNKYEQTAAVTINTGPESINTIGVELEYDPKLVEIEDVSDLDSVCPLQIENTIDNDAGQVHFSCAVPNPGFSGVGTVFSVKFKTRMAGTFGFHFLPETQVLANDGLGTNVLRLATDVSYTARDASTQDDLSLYSPTHPNSEQWYANRSIDFFWGGEAVSTYKYSLTMAPNSILSEADKTIEGHTVTVVAPTDGVYYFHLSRVEKGKIQPAVQYKVNVDTTPPVDITIRSSDSSVNVGDLLRLKLSASDTGSGLQKNYYLSINNGLFFPTQESVYVPFQSTGINTLVARAYDKAGNYGDAQIQINVHGNFIQRLLIPIITK
jgi:hypothetical protein